MAAKSTSAGEHRVQIMSRDAAGRHHDRGVKPEKKLNCFVRTVVLIERLGNALGTLAFTWATVILLGGYPTVLRPDNDFWIATIIVFLEAARMFSRNNRTDYKVFFHTKGAIKPLGWNGLIVIVYLSNILSYLIMLVVSSSVQLPLTFRQITLMFVLVVPTVLGIFRSSRGLELLPKPLRDAVSLCSPLVAVLLLLPLILKFTPRNARAKWLVLFTLVFLVVLLLTVNRLRSQRTSSSKSAKHAPVASFWHRLLLNLCMFVELVMLVLIPGHQAIRSMMFGYEVLAFFLVSFGNLQIPAALIRMVLSVLRLVPHDYHGDGTDSNDPAKANLTPSLSIFYVMVLGQGVLYFAACVLGMFSFIPRRSLARHGGFRGRKGMEFVNLYYEYAWDKCMENDVLARKKISLCSFAMDSVNSDSPTRQLHGAQLMHKLLQAEPSRTRLLSKLNASAETMARIIRMLDRTSPAGEDTGIRLFAAKVVAELARSLRVVTVPGMMQLVSALLDTDRKPKRGCALLDDDTDDEQEGKQAVTGAIDFQDTITGAHDDNQKQRIGIDWFSQQVGIDCQKFFFVRCWNGISGLWSSPSPRDEPPMDHGNLLLPALGMSIFDSLAYCDHGNRVEISRAADLIPKIVEFTHHKNFAENTDDEEQRKILLGSSLKLLRRLSSTGGETGVTLRRKMSEHHALLGNLAEILDDIDAGLETRKLAAETLRNLAVDGSTSREIGRVKVVVTRLVDAFLNQEEDDGPSGTNNLGNQSLQKVAGQALAVLTMESADNCVAVLKEPRDFIAELSNMICRNKHRYVAARLLRNLLLHVRVQCGNSELSKLGETLSKVLATVMDPKADKAELEVTVGLCSQLCRVIPEDDFTRELERANGHQGKEAFVKKLVDALEENVNPGVNCPGIRRVVIEQAIHLMKRGSSQYVALFKRHGMKEALLTVEQTPSRAERFVMFMGNAGLMEHREPVADLVATAEELMR